MPNTQHNTNAASTSFRSPEIDAMRELFRTMRRGGDVRTLVTNQHIANVERKFAAMSERVHGNLRKQDNLSVQQSPVRHIGPQPTFGIPDIENE